MRQRSRSKTHPTWYQKTTLTTPTQAHRKVTAPHYVYRCSVHQRNSGRPFVDCQVYLAGEVVEMTDQGGHDFAHSGRGSGADCVYYALGEERVVAWVFCGSGHGEEWLGWMGVGGEDVGLG
jgi:hypothetical protein